MAQPILATLGKYKLVRKLATGGMAEVYLAKVAGPGGFEKSLVLKRVLPHLAEDENFISMFRSEAKLAAQLNHPNVVSIFDFGQEGDTWFLVMEYIDGPNLRSLFRKAIELAQPIPFGLAAKIISAACEGLAYAHEFIDPETGQPMELVHRDISPDNIVLGSNGGVKVVDFGIAKAANQTHHTRTGTIKGKFAYMPPEQLRGEALDRRADIFALGIVLYELIAGVKPFDTSTDAAIMQAILFGKFKPALERRPDTPPALQAILDRALEKNRDARYPDCHAMGDALDQFIASQGAPVGQHQLAQLVARLNPQGLPVATPSPRPSQPQLPIAPSPSVPPPPPRDSTRSVAIDFKVDEGLLSANDVTVPQMLTPAPMPVPVSLGTPKPSAPQPPPPPERPLGELEGRPLAAAPAAKRSGGMIAAGIAGVALLIGAGLWWKSSQAPGELPPALTPVVVTPPVEPPPVDPPAVEPVIAALPGVLADPVPPPVVIAPVAAEPKAKPRPKGKPKPTTGQVIAAIGKRDPAPPEPVEVKVAPEPVKAEMGMVDFRVRPYASVFVDGTFHGVTPIAKVKLAVGIHAVKLVNKDIGKEVTVQYEVKPGDNTLKFNLESN